MTDFKAKMHQIRFPPLGELTALPRPPCWIWGPLHGRGGAGLGWGRGGKEGGEGEGGEVEGREREGPQPQVTVEPGPLRDLLRHWN